MKNLYQPEARTIDVVESDLTHPAHADGLVDSGDACFAGSLAGVAEESAAASTDVMAIRIHGVVKVPVKGHDGAANAAIAAYAKVYIGTAGLINVDTTKLLYGITLEPVISGATTTIKVLLLN